MGGGSEASEREHLFAPSCSQGREGVALRIFSSQRCQDRDASSPCGEERTSTAAAAAAERRRKRVAKREREARGRQGGVSTGGKAKGGERIHEEEGVLRRALKALQE